MASRRFGLIGHQFELPEFDRLVGTAAGHSAKIRSHGHGPDFALVSRHLLQQTAGRYVKQLEFARLGADDDVTIAGSEQDGQGVIARHRPNAILRAAVPDFQRFATGRGDGYLVRAETQSADVRPMSGDRDGSRPRGVVLAGHNRVHHVHFKRVAPQEDQQTQFAFGR